MSNFQRIRLEFGANWTTILVGWRGPEPFVPWPYRDRWENSPPLVSIDDIKEYIDIRLESCTDNVELDHLVALLELDFENAVRQEIEELLIPLSEIDGGDPQIEFRKWRLVLLEEVLTSLPSDGMYAQQELADFWSMLGFPPDNPHMSGVPGDESRPADYYYSNNLQQVIQNHKIWVDKEKVAIRQICDPGGT